MESEPTDSIEYWSLVGSLIYYTITQPDLSYSVNSLSRFVSAPHDAHTTMARRILKYIKGTTVYCIFFPCNGEKESVLC